MKDILKNNKVDILDSDILDSIGLPPVEHKGPNYNIRKLNEYCRKNNIDPSTLADEELKQFEV